MSIRARLTLAVVLLVVVATGVLGGVVVGAARASMIDRLDERLLDARERPFGGGDFGRPGGGGGQFPDRHAGDLRSIAEVIVDRTGEVRWSDPAGFGDDPEPLPVLPDVPSEEADGLVGRIVTMPAVDDEAADLRVLTTELGPRMDGLRFLAISTSDVQETTTNLRRVYGLTVAAVAAAGALVAWLVVRRGLRPIDSMIETAGAIAAGDLARRVDHPADSTELGRLGAALDEMLSRLEASFDERLASEARLKQFAADASHELRTPITAIRGYAELYRRGGLSEDEALARAMDRIESESTRMGRLVEDLLLLARLDQQRPLERVPVDLRAIVLDAAADHRALGEAHPLTVEADDAVSVIGDESGLRQVVGNLLANARTHTPAGTPVTLSLHVADGGGWTELTVADAGPGISADQRARVFERFHRGDPSRARTTGGSGLGLSIVAAVVAAHSGTVTASDAEGGGAQFTVRLPLA